MPADTGLRVVVIGAGMMGARHAECVAQARDGRLVAVADLDLARARETADRLGARAFRTHHEVLEGVTFDAAVVCTPDWAHVEVCCDLAAAGKHILVEKPLAMTVADCDAIIHACDAAGVTLMVGHLLRFDPRYAAARAEVAAGRVGDLSYLYSRRINTLVQPRRFQGKTTVLHYLGVHEFDWMLWTAREPVTEVRASASRAALRDLGVDDAVFTTLRFASGAVGFVHVAWILPETSSVDLDAYAEAVGTAGSVHIDTSNSGLRAEGEKPRRLDTTYSYSLLGEAAGALREEVNHFLRCVAERREPLIDGRQGRAAVAVAEAAARSALTGAAVSPAA